MNLKRMPKKVIFVKWYEKGRSVVESAITFNLMAEILLKKNSRGHLVRVDINGSFLQKINDRIFFNEFLYVSPRVQNLPFYRELSNLHIL